MCIVWNEALLKDYPLAPTVRCEYNGMKRKGCPSVGPFSGTMDQCRQRNGVECHFAFFLFGIVTTVVVLFLRSASFTGMNSPDRASRPTLNVLLLFLDMVVAMTSLLSIAI